MSDFTIAGTMKNQMAGALTLLSISIEPPSASWDQQPPATIEGNNNGFFKASGGGGGKLSGSVVYLPENSKTKLTFTFTVDGQKNQAEATYPMMGPTVSAAITPGVNASATYAYFR